MAATENIGILDTVKTKVGKKFIFGEGEEVTVPEGTNGIIMGTGKDGIFVGFEDSGVEDLIGYEPCPYKWDEVELVKKAKLLGGE